jgi:hypothetical protein
MTAPGPVRRFLLYGIIFGALTFAAAASGTSAVLWPAPAGAVAPMLHGNQQGGAEASLEYVHWNRFCRWYRHHGFCRKLIEMPRFCDRHPRHRFCDDDDDDRFCRKHPYHRRCDDKPPSPS